MNHSIVCKSRKCTLILEQVLPHMTCYWQVRDPDIACSISSKLLSTRSFSTAHGQSKWLSLSNQAAQSSRLWHISSYSALNHRCLTLYVLWCGLSMFKYLVGTRNAIPPSKPSHQEPVAARTKGSEPFLGEISCTLGSCT